jgi:hypothetical protein
VSTDEVYGSLGEDKYFTEQTRYDPHSPYAATKAAADHLVRAWAHTYGLPVLITNCSNNYCPYQFPEKLIPLMIIKGLAGEPMPVYGSGLNVRDWLFVTDHARALLLVLEHGRIGETYDIGGGVERRNIDVVSAICDALDHLRRAAADIRIASQSASSPIARDTTSDTRSIAASLARSLAGRRAKRSSQVSCRPRSGTSAIINGGSRCCKMWCRMRRGRMSKNAIASTRRERQASIETRYCHHLGASASSHRHGMTRMLQFADSGTGDGRQRSAWLPHKCA